MPLTSSSSAALKSNKVNPVSIPLSTTAVQVLAANPLRIGATIWNESASTLYLELGATVSISSFTVKVTPGSYYECPYEFIGMISGIWSSAGTGTALVREFT
ncbi:MAG: hypothetical protein KME46_32395 [Brasilonema angustatum HA4187-MV1]|jgi:hypothetical protein|nr:hypothetical protein [Brasilonema angustatum HA4187-MV1]